METVKIKLFPSYYKTKVWCNKAKLPQIHVWMNLKTSGILRIFVLDEYKHSKYG